MEHYVTLFDSLFLPQGIALYLSLQRHCKPFKLWVLCVDQKTFDILELLNLDYVQLLSIAEVETTSLKQVRPLRTVGEYCWTLTPFAPRFVFEADVTVDRVTYLDADLWFRKPPHSLFAELEREGKHVLVTDHAYAPELDQSATSGQFCVQFLIFTRNGGETVRRWWEQRCVEWCYNRFEDGKFGDQKYLDDWPQRFCDKVHVLSEKELALGPWNATRYPYSNAVFWHFHGLRLIDRRRGKYRVDLGGYAIPKPTFEYVYLPYLSDLRYSVDLLSEVGFIPYYQAKCSLSYRIKAIARGLLDQTWRLRTHRLVGF